MTRTLWVLVLAALVLLVFYGMRRGWLSRQRRQAALPAFPAVPDNLAEPELLPATGMYVGTTRAGDWQDRIAVGDIGHRANASARLYDSGVLLERDGASPLWIPRESVRDARVDHKLANKVVPGAGLLVVTWQLDDALLDTGFRADDKTIQAEWAQALSETAQRPEAKQDETASSRQEEQQ